MAEVVLRRMKMSWALLCLGLVICDLSFLSLAESISPLLDTDILQAYNVVNVHQCQRLCWYRKSCARYSFYSMNDNSAGNKENCVLYVTEGQIQGQLEGWILAEASSKRMPPDHGCLPRPCSETEICVPYKGAVSFQCIPAPGSEIDECVSSPCQNGGNCVDQLNAYTCSCPAGYSGTNCETGAER
ncbi:uncharacterized protein [Littorina saxatilis]|uniref:uncharacterized protein n=1 Tax=Littorina saxatilis TaxID=31220 RepID=UPI0038B467D4